GGMITPVGNLTVLHGETLMFTCSALTGYQLRNLSIDGNLIGPNTTYSFSNVTSDHTIRVLTTPITTNLNANFTYSNTTGILPLNVTFTDTSSGGPTLWNWNFGDALQNATVRNPVHVYSSNGTWGVVYPLIQILVFV
ncbi:MAG: PKD domain-containing protein, partial [Methanobacteriota archaeon]